MVIIKIDALLFWTILSGLGGAVTFLSFIAQNKQRKKLWIALGAIVVLVLLLVLLWPKLHPEDNSKIQQEQVPLEQTQTQQVAQNQPQPQQPAQQQDGAEAKRKEDEDYRKCTTISGCESYLKAYPKGKYVDEVRAKKAELEQQAREKAEKENVQISVSGSYKGHDYIDLGLPSGTLWATCNVGASKPEDCGSYFAWGETSTKSTYNWSTYKYVNGDYNKLTKYCNKSDYGNNGFTDNQITLQASDDAATAQWGSGWRTPSKAQWEELLKNTTNKWTMQNGVKGRLFTAKNGKVLFLPTAGEQTDDGIMYVGSDGSYWSRSLGTTAPSAAYYIWFATGARGCDLNDFYRCVGFSIRPVLEK